MLLGSVGFCRRNIGRSAIQQGQQGWFVEDGDVEFLGFGEFGASFFAGDDVAGFLADGAGDFAAGGLDFLFGLVAAEGGQGCR